VLKRLERVRQDVERVRAFERRADDLATLYELADGDGALLADLERDAARLRSELDGAMLRLQLNGPYDERDAIVTISAGAGGTDAADWAEMLTRMYMRWCERKGFRCELLDSTPAEEAGVKSAAVGVAGENAFGLLRTERGTHRLVRISPFDFQKRRHTSFALVDVIPQVEADTEVDIRPEDLRIDTYRSTGAGGQNVNKTDSAVRITHLPTGIVVACQNERSQLRNREIAMRILRARLLERRIEEQEREQAKLRGEHRPAEWGNQIRSYVLHPYTLVKDHRTQVEVGDASSVLDGDLDRFIEAALNRRVA
jgi:peptide chain release factor 2